MQMMSFEVRERVGVKVTADHSMFRELTQTFGWAPFLLPPAVQEIFPETVTQMIQLKWRRLLEAQGTSPHQALAQL